jgi:two-component system LytT family sensor kinase
MTSTTRNRAVPDERPRIRSPKAAAIARIANALRLLFAAGILYTVYNTIALYWQLTTAGNAVSWVELFEYEWTITLIWGPLIPVAIALAEALPIRKPHRLRNLLAIGLLLPAMAVGRAALHAVAQNAGARAPLTAGLLVHSIRLWWHYDLFQLALIVTGVQLFAARREAALRQRNAAEMAARLARVELEALRTQLQPHFVFTALDAIARILDTDAAKADAMVVLLADLLRDSLAAGEGEVPLGDELERTDRYLELYRIAFDGRLTATFMAEEEALRILVPALILQPVVEQAIVTVVEPANGGAIAIEATIAGTTLELTVRSGAFQAGLSLASPAAQEAGAA